MSPVFGGGTVLRTVDDVQDTTVRIFGYVWCAAFHGINDPFSHAHDPISLSLSLSSDSFVSSPQELGRVADIILGSFYSDETTGMWKRLYRLAELNRLQQNFAYADQQDRHRMLVVERTTVEPDEGDRRRRRRQDAVVVGFCDVDARPPPPPTTDLASPPPPRPYLSDLCVAGDCRRRGLATALVERAERLCVDAWGRDRLWIRVRESNRAALSVYRRLGYRVVSKDVDATGQEALANNEVIVTLRKDFLTENKES